MKKLLRFSLCCLLFIAAQAYAQDRMVTGKVSAADDKMPIPGVTVKVVGSTQATQTNADGLFTIRVPEGFTQLQFAFLGYAAQTVSIGEGMMNVVLRQDTKQLSEVVVTAMGFQVEKDRLGTSQSSVKGDALVKSGETSVLNGLAGKSSGVQVVRSGGDPGASSYIQIRGQSTITGDLQPLFIIDGIPVSNTTQVSTSGNDPFVSTAGTTNQSRLNDLNPNDIESMEVLKGAAAAALWGTRAANGVIVITTKKGKASDGKVNISFGSTYSVDALNKSVPLQTSFGQGSNGIYSSAFASSRSWGDKISDRTGGEDNYVIGGAYVILPDGTNRYPVANGTALTPHGGKNSKEVYDHATDLFENGSYLENTLSMSGGDDKTLYYMSFSNLDQDGILKAGSDYHRRSFKINADRRFGTNLKLSTNMGYSNIKSNRVQQGSNTSGIFLGGLRTSPDYDNTFYEGTYVDASGALFPNRQISYRNQLGARTNSGYDNPFWVINKITSQNTVNRFFGSFESKYDYKPWLSFIARLGADFYSDNRTENYPVLSSSKQGGNLTIQEISEMQFNGDFIGKVSKDISDKISFTGLIGFNYNNRNFENIGATVTNFILPDAPIDLGNSDAAARFPFNSNSTIRTAATYTQFSFGFYDQLFVDLTGRGERSSTFSDVFYYPSASLAWQFTKLQSLQDLKALTFGKIRASYGEVGVQPGPYLAGSYFAPASLTESWGPTLDASSSTYGGGYTKSSIQGNPNIEPERKTEVEFGADFRFFSDKLSLSTTYYSNRTKGAIFSVQVPASTGFTSKNDNAAEIENKGFETDLGINWLKSSNWNISSTATWSTNKNKVISLKGVKSFFLNGFAGTSSRAVEGEALGALWGLDFNREADGKLILDANGFPTSAPSESVIGDPNPDWTAGITNNFRYKNIGLSFLIDYVKGGDVWNGTRGALVNFGTHASVGNEVTATSDLKTFNGNTITSGTTFRGAIQDFGAGPVALTQVWYTDLGGGFGPVGSQFIEDGTRTRLREISLNYTLGGEKFRNATKLQSIDFSITGRNIALWTKYTGIDPETNLTGPSNGRGLDYFNNPSTRSYFFTLKINY